VKTCLPVACSLFAARVEPGSRSRMTRSVGVQGMHSCRGPRRAWRGRTRLCGASSTAWSSSTCSSSSSCSSRPWATRGRCCGRAQGSTPQLPGPQEQSRLPACCPVSAFHSGGACLGTRAGRKVCSCAGHARLCAAHPLIATLEPAVPRLCSGAAAHIRAATALCAAQLCRPDTLARGMS